MQHRFVCSHASLSLSLSLTRRSAQKSISPFSNYNVDNTAPLTPPAQPQFSTCAPAPLASSPPWYAPVPSSIAEPLGSIACTVFRTCLALVKGSIHTSKRLRKLWLESQEKTKQLQQHHHHISTNKTMMVDIEEHHMALERLKKLELQIVMLQEQLAELQQEMGSALQHSNSPSSSPIPITSQSLTSTSLCHAEGDPIVQNAIPIAPPLAQTFNSAPTIRNTSTAPTASVSSTSATSHIPTAPPISFPAAHRASASTSMTNNNNQPTRTVKSFFPAAHFPQESSSVSSLPSSSLSSTTNATTTNNVINQQMLQLQRQALKQAKRQSTQIKTTRNSLPVTDTAFLIQALQAKFHRRIVHAPIHVAQEDETAGDSSSSFSPLAASPVTRNEEAEDWTPTK